MAAALSQVRFCAFLVKQCILVLTILRYLSRAVRRDLATLGSFRANNFFLFVALLMWGALESGQPPASAYPFLLLLGLLLLFPLSSDPLTRIPQVRLALWPLSARDRFALRMVSLALSPVLWLVLVLMLIAAPSMALAFLALAAAVQLALVAARHPSATLRLPERLGGMAKNSIRQIWSVLDVYIALAISAGGSVYRFLHRHPDPAAFPILAMLVALALSTWSQSLFGLDSASGVTRYRIMPLTGVRVLWAKDVSLLAILSVLVLPLDLRAGLTFGFAVLAVGHIPSVLLRLPQRRWRFTSGRVIFSVVQVMPATALANAGLLLPAAAGWLLSLYLCGRWWDRQPLH